MKNMKALIAFVCAILLCYTSCQKKNEVGLNQENQLEKRFFYYRGKNDFSQRLLIDLLRRQNSKTEFITLTTQRIGFPRWDHVFSVQGKSATKVQSDAITYYIPFVRDSQPYVNAVMAIHISQFDTTMKYLCDWQYLEKENKLTQLTDTAEYYSAFFMALNRQVFNQTVFDITDESLFNKNNKKPYAVSLINLTNQSANRLAPVEYCQDIKVSFVDCQYPGHPSCTPKCDRCPQCISSFTYQYCWVEYVDDGGGGSTLGSGSSMSGGVDYTPPPCGGSNPIAKTEELEGCGPGWASSGGNAAENQLLSQLSAISAPGDIFSIDKSITVPNAFSFNSVSNFANFLTSIKTNTSFTLNVPETLTSPNQKIEKSRVNLTFIGGIDLYVHLNKTGTNWMVADVTSEDWGATLGWEWNQKAFSVGASPTEIIIDVIGYIKYNIIIDGIGTVYKKRKHYQIKLNPQTGKIIKVDDKS